jgi:hypothetical protein
MTGYKSKKAAAQDKLAQTTQETAAFIAAEKRKVGTRYGYVPKLHPSEYMEEQPAQEPVAWSDEHLQFLNFLYGAGEFDGVWFDQKHPKEKGEFWWRKHLRRLFDAPQRRPWVEPTAGEWFKCWLDLDAADETEAEFDFADFLIIAQAVVAKLKEKHNG